MMQTNPFAWLSGEIISGELGRPLLPQAGAHNRLLCVPNLLRSPRWVALPRPPLGSWEAQLAATPYQSLRPGHRSRLGGAQLHQSNCWSPPHAHVAHVTLPR